MTTNHDWSIHYYDLAYQAFDMALQCHPKYCRLNLERALRYERYAKAYREAAQCETTSR